MTKKSVGFTGLRKSEDPDFAELMDRESSNNFGATIKSKVSKVATSNADPDFEDALDRDDDSE
jgi:hypothetical protein